MKKSEKSKQRPMVEFFDFSDKVLNLVRAQTPINVFHVGSRFGFCLNGQVAMAEKHKKCYVKTKPRNYYIEARALWHHLLEFLPRETLWELHTKFLREYFNKPPEPR